MKKNLKHIIIISTIFVLIVPAIHSTSIDLANQQEFVNPIEPTLASSEYKGTLRIYIAEIESRWDNYDGDPYHYAFLDFAFNDEIEITYLDTYEDSISWQGDVQEGNVIIYAAVFNSEKNTGYAQPPNDRPFDAYYVDAATACELGQTNSNVKNEDFTHTIFCEIATATTCKYCPNMAAVLESIYAQEIYPFYFVEMVTDKSNLANTRIQSFNPLGFPTAFYDGGYQVFLGGSTEESLHKEKIEECGKRDVHDLDLTLSTSWEGSGAITIDISITNNEEITNLKPDNPTINGPDKVTAEQSTEYEIQTTDPDGDDVSYLIDWGDGSDSGWIGPHSSGETITESHTWSNRGSFNIKVKARDPDGLESDWTSLSIKVPKSKAFNYPFLEWMFARYPILEQLSF